MGRGSWVVGTSRESWVYPLRIDIDLEICSHVPRIFLAGREFFSSVENIFSGREFFGWSRMFFFLFRDNLIGEGSRYPK